MNPVTAYIVVYEDQANITRKFSKEMNFAFKPVLGEQVVPIAPYVGDHPLPDLVTPIVEASYDYNGRLRIRLSSVLVAPSYETQESFKAMGRDYITWSLLGGGDVCDHLLDSRWMELSDDDD